MLGYLAYEITAGIFGFMFEITAFELFKYFYSEIPDLIIIGVDDKEQIAEALTKSIKKALAEVGDEI